MQLQLPDHPPLSLDRPLIMGILNATPDSFSDGGMYTAQDTAVAHALEMIVNGADIIDIGGESTRPGAQRVSADEQIARTVGVIARLHATVDQSEHPIAISIDTTRAEVAQAAVDAGAAIINDVSAGTDDPAILRVAADTGAPIVLMHKKGQPADMQADPRYDDVVAEVRDYLLERASAAQDAGVPRHQIVIDPGIGFGKTKAHNLTLLAHLDTFVATGYPVLLGTSRKRFMGAIATKRSGEKPEPTQLVGATCATTAMGVAAGVQMFRVHDVYANRQAADVAWAIMHP